MTKITKFEKQLNNAFTKNPKRIIKDITKATKSVVDNKINPYITALIKGRRDYSPNIKSFLDKHGSENITQMKVARDPISKPVQTILDQIGTTPYDKLFHLRIVAVTDKGTKFTMEKNQNLNIGPHFTKSTEDHEEMPVTAPNVSIDEYLDKGRKQMGSKRFFNYTVDNNCQVFIKNLLTANGMNDSNIIEFVKQDTKSLFKGKENMRKAANTVTDIAGRAEILVSGGTVKKTNKWIKHVQDFAKKNKISYRDAMRDSKCKQSYKK